VTVSVYYSRIILTVIYNKSYGQLLLVFYHAGNYNDLIQVSLLQRNHL
jgi:hypothetical protein